MATTNTNNATGKIAEYRRQLKSITNKLVEMAKMSGRTDYTYNQLLRECYSLVGVKLRTIEDWNADNYSVKKGQHAFLFWGQPVTSEKGYTYCPIQFLFAQDQVELRAIAS